MARRAIIRIAPEILHEVIRLVSDHGLSVERTLDSGDGFDGLTCALGVSGEGLPERCEESAGPAPIVTLTITTEAYGSQRLTRISEIRVDDFATAQFRRARKEAA